MFIILYYDVNEKFVTKMLKTCRKYLIWVQNSVFEGELSIADYEKMIVDIKNKIKKDDSASIIIYKFRTMKYSERVVLGHDKKTDIKFI